MDTSTTVEQLPDWLTALPPEDPVRYPRTKEHLAVQKMTYETLFERVIEGVEGGETVTAIVKADPRNIDLGNFLGWIRRNPERLARFEDAKQNGTIVLEEKMVAIAIGADSMDDTQRAKLQVDTIKWIMQVWNRKRYGAEKDQTSNNPFANGVTIVIGDVQPKQIGNTYDNG